MIRLSKYGDILAGKSGLGRTWIGVVLMASVTSLPELVTGISSVTIASVPDIAVGDVLGSCVFNMLILSMLDVICRTMPVSTRAHHGNVLSGGFGMLLLSLVSLSIVAGEFLRPFGWIGISTVLFVIVHILAMRIAFFHEQRHIAA